MKATGLPPGLRPGYATDAAPARGVADAAASRREGERERGQDSRLRNVRSRSEVHSVRNVGGGQAAELATYVVETGKPFIVLAE